MVLSTPLIHIENFQSPCPMIGMHPGQPHFKGLHNNSCSQFLAKFSSVTVHYAKEMEGVVLSSHCRRWFVQKYLHWNPAHALSSREDGSEPFSLGPSTESMLKRSVAKSTFGGEIFGVAWAFCVESVWAIVGSAFESKETCLSVKPSKVS